MAFGVDIILLTAIVFLIAYILFSFLSMPFALQLVCAALATIVIVATVNKFFCKDRKRGMNYRNFLTYLIWQGEDYTKELLKSVAKDKVFEDKGEYVMIQDTAVFLWTKYGRLSADSLVRLYRICVKDGIRQAKILTTNPDKKSLSFVKRFAEVVITFDSFKPLYKQLKSQNTLPDLKTDKIDKRRFFKLILESAFTRKNGFRFVGVSVLLVAISFVTPFANYYLTLATINLIFALACVIKSLSGK